MKKILITGISGQIGSELAQLLEKKYGAESIMGIDINPSSSKIRVENISVTSYSQLSELVEKEKITEIYHLAAILSAKGERYPELAWEVNLNGTKNIFDLARKYKLKVFWPSTIAVFGEGTPRINTPQDALRHPSTMYGITKVAGENLAEYYINNFGVDIRSVRFPGIISYKTEPGGGTTDYAVAIFFEAIKSGKYECFVSKETTLPMMYMEDALQAIVKIMDASRDVLTIKTSYNLAGLSFSVDELAKEIQKHIPLEVTYKPDYRQKIADLWPASIDDSVAQRDWDWKANVNLETLTIKMLEGINNLKQNNMLNKNYINTLQKELDRIDSASIAKRNELVIEGYTSELSPKAIIDHKPHLIFNSNDYLGLRFDERLIKSEHEASMQYGTSPGAVRFISGTCKVYLDCEEALARFHKRDSAMLTSSAFAANVGVIQALIKGQSKDSVVSGDTMVLSDALNHRSIIDGIRVANLPQENRKTYNHLDIDHVRQLLRESKGKFTRVLIVTDGIFSMLGERAPLARLRELANEYQDYYQEGVLLLVDDSHGVGVYGQSGRGTQEYEGVKADILIGTLGKAFGSDGGYVVSDKILIDYLREAAQTYIYSNPISPGVAASALTSLKIMSGTEGEKILAKLYNLVNYFRLCVKEADIPFAAESDHPIQPILIGDAKKAQEVAKKLLDKQIVVTSISYPIVPRGRDEIRVQINASHQKQDIETLVNALKVAITV